jgi:GSCFA family
MAIPHPYKSAPKSSFWSRAVATDWNPSEVVGSHGCLIRKGDKVVSAGSCFASNIVPYLEKAGLTYLRTEATHPAFQDLERETLGYANFSAAYGNIYTARQLLQLFKRSLKTFSPVEDRWPADDSIVDTLRPGLRYRARSHREFDLLTAQHLRKTYEAFESADVFVFTLGLTEGWVSRLDGTVFPACAGTVAGSFDPERHEFKNFSVSEVIGDLDEFIRLLRQINPKVRLIVTVSPVPLVATATGNHVLSASIYSKSVLRVAAGEITKCHPDVTYFPAYEIVTGPQAPENFFEKDRRNVSQSGVEAVMSAMLAHCEVIAQDDAGLPVVPLMEQSVRRESVSGATASKISQLIAKAECEEAMADSPFPSTLAASIRSDLGARDVDLEEALRRVGPSDHSG